MPGPEDIKATITSDQVLAVFKTNGEVEYVLSSSEPYTTGLTFTAEKLAVIPAADLKTRDGFQAVETQFKQKLADITPDSLQAKITAKTADLVFLDYYYNQLPEKGEERTKFVAKLKNIMQARLAKTNNPQLKEAIANLGTSARSQSSLFKACETSVEAHQVLQCVQFTVGKEHCNIPAAFTYARTVVLNQYSLSSSPLLATCEENVVTVNETVLNRSKGIAIKSFGERLEAASKDLHTLNDAYRSVSGLDSNDRKKAFNPIFARALSDEEAKKVFQEALKLIPEDTPAGKAARIAAANPNLRIIVLSKEAGSADVPYYKVLDPSKVKDYLKVLYRDSVGGYSSRGNPNNSDTNVVVITDYGDPKSTSRITAHELLHNSMKLVYGTENQKTFPLGDEKVIIKNIGSVNFQVAELCNHMVSDQVPEDTRQGLCDAINKVLDLQGTQKLTPATLGKNKKMLSKAIQQKYKDAYDPLAEFLQGIKAEAVPIMGDNYPLKNAQSKDFADAEGDKHNPLDRQARMFSDERQSLLRTAYIKDIEGLEGKSRRAKLSQFRQDFGVSKKLYSSVTTFHAEILVIVMEMKAHGQWDKKMERKYPRLSEYADKVAAKDFAEYEAVEKSGVAWDPLVHLPKIAKLSYAEVYNQGLTPNAKSDAQAHEIAKKPAHTPAEVDYLKKWAQVALKEPLDYALRSLIQEGKNDLFNDMLKECGDRLNMSETLSLADKAIKSGNSQALESILRHCAIEEDTPKHLRDHIASESKKAELHLTPDVVARLNAAVGAYEERIKTPHGVDVRFENLPPHGVQVGPTRTPRGGTGTKNEIRPGLEELGPRVSPSTFIPKMFFVPETFTRAVMPFVRATTNVLGGNFSEASYVAKGITAVGKAIQRISGKLQEEGADDTTETKSTAEQSKDAPPPRIAPITPGPDADEIPPVSNKEAPQVRGAPGSVTPEKKPIIDLKNIANSRLVAAGFHIAPASIGWTEFAEGIRDGNNYQAAMGAAMGASGTGGLLAEAMEHRALTHLSKLAALKDEGAIRILAQYKETKSLGLAGRASGVFGTVGNTLMLFGAYSDGEQAYNHFATEGAGSVLGYMKGGKSLTELYVGAFGVVNSLNKARQVAPVVLTGLRVGGKIVSAAGKFAGPVGWALAPVEIGVGQTEGYFERLQALQVADEATKLDNQANNRPPGVNPAYSSEQQMQAGRPATEWHYPAFGGWKDLDMAANIVNTQLNKQKSTTEKVSVTTTAPQTFKDRMVETKKALETEFEETIKANGLSDKYREAKVRNEEQFKNLTGLSRFANILVVADLFTKEDRDKNSKLIESLNRLQGNISTLDRGLVALEGNKDITDPVTKKPMRGFELQRPKMVKVQRQAVDETGELKWHQTGPGYDQKEPVYTTVIEPERDKNGNIVYEPALDKSGKPLEVRSFQADYEHTKEVHTKLAEKYGDILKEQMKDVNKIIGPQFQRIDEHFDKLNKVFSGIPDIPWDRFATAYQDYKNAPAELAHLKDPKVRDYLINARKLKMLGLMPQLSPEMLRKFDSPQFNPDASQARKLYNEGKEEHGQNGDKEFLRPRTNPDEAMFAYHLLEKTKDSPPDKRFQAIQDELGTLSDSKLDKEFEALDHSWQVSAMPVDQKKLMLEAFIDEQNPITDEDLNPDGIEKRGEKLKADLKAALADPEHKILNEAEKAFRKRAIEGYLKGQFSRLDEGRKQQFINAYMNGKDSAARTNDLHALLKKEQIHSYVLQHLDPSIAHGYLPLPMAKELEAILSKNEIEGALNIKTNPFPDAKSKKEFVEQLQYIEVAKETMPALQDKYCIAENMHIEAITPVMEKGKDGLPKISKVRLTLHDKEKNQNTQMEINYTPKSDGGKQLQYALLAQLDPYAAMKYKMEEVDGLKNVIFERDAKGAYVEFTDDRTYINNAHNHYDDYHPGKKYHEYRIYGGLSEADKTFTTSSVQYKDDDGQWQDLQHLNPQQRKESMGTAEPATYVNPSLGLFGAHHSGKFVIGNQGDSSPGSMIESLVMEDNTARVLAQGQKETTIGKEEIEGSVQNCKCKDGKLIIPAFVRVTSSDGANAKTTGIVLQKEISYEQILNQFDPLSKLSQAYMEQATKTGKPVSEKQARETIEKRVKRNPDILAQFAEKNLKINDLISAIKTWQAIPPSDEAARQMAQDKITQAFGAIASDKEASGKLKILIDRQPLARIQKMEAGNVTYEMAGNAGTNLQMALEPLGKELAVRINDDASDVRAMLTQLNDNGFPLFKDTPQKQPTPGVSYDASASDANLGTLSPTLPQSAETPSDIGKLPYANITGNPLVAPDSIINFILKEMQKLQQK